VFQKLSKEQIASPEAKQKIGLISFTDPRRDVTLVSEREDYIKDCHNDLITELVMEGFEVVDPLSEYHQNEEGSNELFGIATESLTKKMCFQLLEQEVSALLIGCWGWTSPRLPLLTTRFLDIPIALVTQNNKDWPGITSLLSTGATFWEVSPTFYSKNHERFILEPAQELFELTTWLRAACAVNHLRTGKMILWGGSPALHMSHLSDDQPFLERFLIDELISVDQFELIQGAEELQILNEERITKFRNWLNENNCEIEYDQLITSRETIFKEIALYLAAKDAIAQRISQGERIIGASVKCQPELSVKYAVTPCLIPAFLPFPEDHEGKKPIIPTVCEGDIKGLITSSLLFGLNNEIPPLFGDIRAVTDDTFVLGNCGGGCAYYGNNSLDPKKTLSKTFIRPQCQGESGGTFGFITPKTRNEATYARLIRVDNTYILQAGSGKIDSLDEDYFSNWGSNWPATAVKLKISKNLFCKAVGSNHLSLIIGDFLGELKIASQLLGLKFVNLNQTGETEAYLEYL
jgi:L-fucose isomerase-like protein